MDKKNLDDDTPKEQKTGLNNATKAEILHQYKLSLVRECQIYGKPLKEVQAYFKTKGLKISKKSWQNYKNELRSKNSAKNWFSKQALYLIEEDHMISCERIISMENQIVKDFWETENPVIRDKLLARFESLQMTKTKMFSATPMVQELMEVHARQEEEANNPTTAVKTEKPQHAK